MSFPIPISSSISISSSSSISIAISCCGGELRKPVVKPMDGAAERGGKGS
jgi:hypothetical protein